MLKRLTEQVDLSSAALSDSVSRSAENSIGALAGSSERLRGELVQVIDNLGKTGGAIDHAVDSASNRLAAVQGGLAARVDEFQRALGGIASQVATLGRIASTTQTDAGALATRLSQHAESLGLVARDLAAQQQSFDVALEQRQKSLEALVGDLAARGAAFDTLLERFAANVEDSFGKAQSRAQEIASVLASTTRGASVAVAGQFETIRDTAAKERERTAQTLRETIDQTNAQISGALDHAAERFRKSVAEVKEMASQVQKELDETRQELRRGVLDLPQETSETAEAMRRVVADQIRALKELAALVSDSGADLRRRRADRGRRHRCDDRIGEGAVRADAAHCRAYAPGRGAVAARGGSGASSRDDRGVGHGNSALDADCRSGTRSPARWRAGSTLAGPHLVGPTRPAAPAAAPAAVTDRAQTGWLSNLLAAASREEPDVPAPRGIETLEALTEGIGGLIDSAAAVEMWDRWRRGDSAAVSRRLYTEAGQQAFDEIRRRYRADPQFRETATRYTQEFERLLAKVSQNDRDGSQWRAYLLSNTGKVYTILAHASGRLG